jgi:hypothetical protein
MKRIFPVLVVFATVAISATVLAQWFPLAPDPALWPYADGPTQEVVALPHMTYRLGGAVGIFDGMPAIFSGGGVSLFTYSRDLPGTDPKYWGNRQSHFSIYTPGFGWTSANGTDDTNNGDGTWTSVGLTGYNNGKGTNSPLVGEGTGYVMDQAFYFNNAFYIFGGYPQWGSNMAKYNTLTNSWSQVAYGNDDTLYMNGGTLIGSHYYKVRNAGNLMDYDAGTDTFGPDIAIAGLIKPQFGSASGTIGSTFYVVDADNAATPGAVYAIDPVAASFATGASTPTPVREAGSVVWNGKFFLLGGRAGAANTAATDKIQVYDPLTDSWYLSVVKLPSARSGFLAEVIGNTLYVGNGLNNVASPGTAAINDFWMVDMNQVAIPEPGTILLVGSGLLGLLFLKRKK